MDKEPLVQPFPMPSERIRMAYWDLYLSDEGTAAQKKRLGQADLLPRPWDIATVTDPDLRRDVWDWYENVVTWFNHEYVWDPTAGMIPPCWPQHPHLIHDIGVLADQRRIVATATNSNALEEWHRYSIPAFLERLHDRVKQHCDNEHQAWPARARYARHSSGETLRLGRLRNEPRPMPAPSPSLRLVDKKSGQLIDPATGEIEQSSGLDSDVVPRG